MPERTTCVRCGKTGLVRREASIEGRDTRLNYSCGHCHESWSVAEGSADGEGRPSGHPVSLPPSDSDRRTGERRASERRLAERRVSPRPSAAASVDVSRIEHENLLKQVAAHEQAIRRLEEQVRRLREQSGAPRRRSKYPLVSD